MPMDQLTRMKIADLYNEIRREAHPQSKVTVIVRYPTKPNQDEHFSCEDKTDGLLNSLLPRSEFGGSDAVENACLRTAHLEAKNIEYKTLLESVREFFIAIERGEYSERKMGDYERTFIGRITTAIK